MHPDDDSLGVSAPRPHRIATIGLHGSASTWVFSVVRELLIASSGEGHLVSVYADERHQLPPDHVLSGRHLLVKSHQGSSALDEWLASSDLHIVMSIRDPRDAAVSMAQRFKIPLSFAADWVKADCDRVARLPSSRSSVLRYEDRFFDEPRTIAQLAGQLSLAVAPSAMQSIFARYRTEAVRMAASALIDDASDRVTRIGQFLMDRVTQINEVHTGDTRSGKWRDLPEQTQTKLTELFASFIEQFDYF
jgi:hypothetical protein